MSTIQDIKIEYTRKIDFLDLELLIADSLNKTREFVLSHPEHELTKSQISNLKSKLNRRIKGEPIAYIMGHKEFYGLEFLVNMHTLVPRPETEQIVDLVISNPKLVASKITIIDIGTGSGNIIISIAKTIFASCDLPVNGYSFFATDISKEALKIAKKNSKTNGLDKEIKFLHGDLLLPFLKTDKQTKLKTDKLIIIANLPYLSKEIYQSAPIDVKKYEPKSALYSPEHGLRHYRKLLEQIIELLVVSCKLSVVCFFEISPEQKSLLTKLIKTILPKAKISFHKDLAGKWRVCKITI